MRAARSGTIVRFANASPNQPTREPVLTASTIAIRRLQQSFCPVHESGHATPVLSFPARLRVRLAPRELRLVHARLSRAHGEGPPHGPMPWSATPRQKPCAAEPGSRVGGSDPPTRYGARND